METKQQAAERVLGTRKEGESFDCALPQSWVDEMATRGFDVRPHFVWLYPSDDIFGYPYPITQEGIHMLGKLARSG